MQISLPAFAKINLDLRILGTRPDGYHDLRTIFQSLGISDRLTFTARRGPFEITCDDPDVPVELFDARDRASVKHVLTILVERSLGLARSDLVAAAGGSR